jgi:hypothetical protein
MIENGSPFGENSGAIRPTFILLPTVNKFTQLPTPGSISSHQFRKVKLALQNQNQVTGVS